MAASGAAAGAAHGRCAEPAVSSTGRRCLSRDHRPEEIRDRGREMILDLIRRPRDHRCGDLAEEW